MKPKTNDTENGSIIKPLLLGLALLAATASLTFAMVVTKSSATLPSLATTTGSQGNFDFGVGDTSDSTSEKWQMTIIGSKKGDKARTVLMDDYGITKTAKFYLSHDQIYSITLEHKGSSQKVKDYDWLAQVRWLNPDGKSFSAWSPKALVLSPEAKKPILFTTAGGDVWLLVNSEGLLGNTRIDHKNTKKNEADGKTAWLIPLQFFQANMPNVNNGTLNPNTTDMGFARTPYEIRPGGVAYITGEPAMPKLIVRFPGAPASIKAEWKLEVTSERSERGNRDNIAYPAKGFQSITGHNSWDIGAAFGNDFVGGKCLLTCRINSQQVQIPFFIRGKNPKDVDVEAYITSHVGYADFPNILYMMRHESRLGSRIYNQFNCGGKGAEPKELPDKGGVYGWGIAMLDEGQFMAGKKGAKPVTTVQVYNWKVNIDGGFKKIQDTRPDVSEFFRNVSFHFPNNINAASPPAAYKLNAADQTVLSASDWSIMVRYNGGAGTLLMTGMKRYNADGTLKKDSDGNVLIWNIRMPWEFVLANQTSPLNGWNFKDNQETYAHKVVHEKEHLNNYIQE